MVDETPIPTPVPIADPKSQLELLLDALNPLVGEGVVEKYGPIMVALAGVVLLVLEGMGSIHVPPIVLAILTALAGMGGWFARHQAG